MLWQQVDVKKEGRAGYGSSMTGLGWEQNNLQKIFCWKCDDAGSGLDEILPVGLRDSANVFLNYRLQGFYLSFSHDHQFLCDKQ